MLSGVRVSHSLGGHCKNVDPVGILIDLVFQSLLAGGIAGIEPRVKISLAFFWMGVSSARVKSVELEGGWTTGRLAIKEDGDLDADVGGLDAGDGDLGTDDGGFGTYDRDLGTDDGGFGADDGGLDDDDGGLGIDDEDLGADDVADGDWLVGASGDLVGATMGLVLETEEKRSGRLSILVIKAGEMLRVSAHICCL